MMDRQVRLQYYSGFKANSPPHIYARTPSSAHLIHEIVMETLRYTLVILELQRLRRDNQEFKDSLCYIRRANLGYMRPSFRNKW